MTAVKKIARKQQVVGEDVEKLETCALLVGI